MADITFREWFEVPPSLLLPPGLAQLVPPAIDQICNMHYTAPSETAAALGLTDLPSPTSSYLLPRLCPNPPPTQPQPGTPQPSGQGCISYDITVSGVDGRGSPYTLNYRLPGKIGGIVWVEGVGAPDRFSGGFELLHSRDCPGRTPGKVALVGGQNMPQMPTARITAMVPVGGGTDPGGTVPAPYPPAPQPPQFFRPNITVNIGGQNVNFPITFAPTSPSPNYPTRPQINFNIGNQISVNITGDGFTFGNPASPTRPPGQPGNPIPPGGRLPALPAPPLIDPPPGTGSGGGGTPTVCPDVNLQPVLDAIAVLKLEVDEVEEDVKLLLDCDRCDRPPASLCSKRLIGTGSSAVFQLGERAVWVGVEVTQRPTNWKGYLVDNSPDVLICGWHEFGSAIAQGVRTPIQYEKNIYPVLEGAEKFSFGLQSGHIANYYVYDKPDEEI